MPVPEQKTLAGFEPNGFLATHWQQEPLLLRGAVTNFGSPVSGDELAGLSLDDDIESRLVVGSGTALTMNHGPFDAGHFASLGEADWTLLVQAVDLWIPAVRAVLEYFDFLPRWRVDDVMVSYAAPGGGVGPHFDAYDVFLLQVEGEREWRLGQRCDQSTEIETGSGLRLLRTFDEKARFVLAPGDLLYVPPNVAHWGIAQSPCITYSVGYRSPTLAEMLGDLATELAARGDDRIYRDPPLDPALATEAIDPAFIDQVRNLLRTLADDEALLTDWFARFMTAPRYPDLPGLPDRRARTAAGLYVNGERGD